MSQAPSAFKNMTVSGNPKDLVELYKSYYNFEAVPVEENSISTGAVVLQSDADTNVENIKKQEAQAINTITPFCTTLNINTAYTLGGTATGGSYCYHFEVSQRAKTQVFLVGQNVNTDFALTLVRHETDDTLTAMGTSDQPGNADESLLALTEPGDYYWLMDANASDGGDFQFGALINTSIDDHELNDVIGLSTAIPDGRTLMIGSMDSDEDIDYFHYVADNGQDLQIRLTDSYGQNEWLLEYFTGTAWAALNANTLYDLSSLPSPFTLHVRISPNPAVTVNPAHDYELLVGRRITASDSVDVGSNENLAPIGLSDFNPSLSTQVHNELNWSIRVLDSNGTPVEGAVVNFHYFTEDIAIQVDTALSGSNGVASNSIALPDCVGNNSIIHSTGGNTWRTEFDLGQWFIRVDDTDYNEVGVGGDQVPAVWMGHICRQTLQ